MSMTGGSLINQALLMLGRLYPGESASASEQTDALLVINNLLDNWSLERINVPVVVDQQHALINGTNTYTFGAGGTFGTTRYVRIETAHILSGAFRLPVEIVSREKIKAQIEPAEAAAAPRMLYYDFQFPTATAELWPTPNATNTLEIGGWQALANFPDTTTVIVTPAGYDRPLVLNVAVELAPQYSVAAQILEVLIENAKEAKAAIRAMNASNFGQPEMPPPSGPLTAIPPQAAAPQPT